MKRWIIALLAALALLAPATAGARVIFDTEFNQAGHLDKPWVANGGQFYWSGQCEQPNHVSEWGGYLRLTDTPGLDCPGTTVTSGSVFTTWSYTYGTATARLKVPCDSGYGLWPAFWHYAFWAPTLVGEIDDVELMHFGGSEFGSHAYQSIHGLGLHGTSQRRPNPSGNVPFCSAFHTFGDQWTSQYVRFFIDGHREKTWWRSQLPAWPLYTPENLVLDLAVGYLGGVLNTATLPQTMLVDWVRVTQP